MEFAQETKAWLKPWSLHHKKRQGLIAAGAEEAHKDDPRDGTAFLWGKAERTWAVQPGEERALGRPYNSSQCLKRFTRKMRMKFLVGPVTRDNDF